MIIFTILILTLKTACLTNIFKLRVGYADLVAPENTSLFTVENTFMENTLMTFDTILSPLKWSEATCFSYSSFYSGLAHSQIARLSRTSLRTGNARETSKWKGSSLSPRAPILLIEKSLSSTTI